MDKRPAAAALLIRSWFFLASICANLTLCILIWDIDRSEGLINEAALQHVLEVFKQSKTHILIFLTLSTTIFFLASTLLLDESYKDIIIIAMIWALPLFIH